MPLSPDARAGFSTLEVLVVLAIMSLAVAIILPRGAAMLDRMTSHVVFFEFQQAVAEARREAFRSERGIVLAGSAATEAADARAIPLRDAWTYRLDRPLEITAGGRCTDVTAVLSRDGRPVMRLRSEKGACRFIRLD